MSDETIDKASLWRIERNRARRERIAIRCLHSMLGSGSWDPEIAAERAVTYADALIAELDKEDVE